MASPVWECRLPAAGSGKSYPMQHYVEIKDQYPHALLLYRVGDFYEVFFRMPVRFQSNWN